MIIFLKKLIKGFFNKNGINYTGKKTCRHKGGGHKRNYRFSNLNYNIWNILGIVKKIEYDSYRSCYIFLICYQNGILCWILATYLSTIGHFIKLSNLNYLIIGTNMILKKLALGLQISQIQTNNWIKLSRSAGIYSKPLFFIKNYNVILLKSGKKKLIFFFFIATIGRISNIKHILRLRYKAGQSIWKNKKPCVRGIAMNPVDHPNGGRTSGKYYLSYSSRIYKWKRTRKKKNTNKFLLKN